MSANAALNCLTFILEIVLHVFVVGVCLVFASIQDHSLPNECDETSNIILNKVASRCTQREGVDRNTDLVIKSEKHIILLNRCSFRLTAGNFVSRALTESRYCILLEP